jgi:ATP/maltotriose-dependent transcriptional regulator MalT
LRTALRFSLDRGHTETALRLASALQFFWLERGYLNEGRVWLEEALDSERASASAVRARALAGAGILAHYQGDYTRARELSEESLAASEALGDQAGVARALTALALVARSSGSTTEADALFRDVLGIYDELGDREGLARTLDRHGIVLLFREEYDRALALIHQSLGLFRDFGDAAGAALAKIDLGIVTEYAGDLAAAPDLVEEGLAVFRQLGDRRNAAKALWILGDIWCELGDHAAAAAHLEESLTLFLEFGDRWFAALALERAAGAALAAGDAERSGQLFGAADGLRESIGAPVPGCMRARNERDRALVARALGAQRFEAARLEGRAMPLRSTVDLVRGTVPAPADDRSEALTSRELDVLGLVAHGLTDAQVAEALVVSLRTVHAHLRSIYRKLDVHSRSAATRYAVEHGLARDAA